MPGVTHLADLLNLHREPETLQRVDVMVLCVITHSDFDVFDGRISKDAFGDGV